MARGVEGWRGEGGDYSREAINRGTEEIREASNVISDPKCNKGPKRNNFWP